MKLIKLDRRHHGHRQWTHALQFTKQECAIRSRKHAPYVKAFTDIYGKDQWFDPSPAVSWRDSTKYNEHWRFDRERRRIYIKDPTIMSFIELKIT